MENSSKPIRTSFAITRSWFNEEAVDEEDSSEDTVKLIVFGVSGVVRGILSSICRCFDA